MPSDTPANPYAFSNGESAPPPVRDGKQTWTGGITDGQSAQSWPVEVGLLPDGLALTRPGAEAPSAVWHYRDLSTGEPIRSGAGDVLVACSTAPRMSLHVKNADFARRLAGLAPQTTLRSFRLGGLKVGAPVGAVALALTALVYGFDLAPTKAVARLMPDVARERLGRNVLASLPINENDRRVCNEPAGRAAVDALARRLLPGEKDPSRRVLVLNWPLVNAFAVPGGQVILTRGIIEKAAGPDEIAGVLAHEIGHGLELHPEAGLVRAVGFWALIQMVFTGTPGALGNIGSSLVQLAHNRGFEREADAIAIRMLREAQVSPKAFAGFFRRMEGNRPEKPGSSRSPFGLPNDMFDTHPSSPERIRAIESQADYPSTPSLTAEQWQAMRTICRGLAASSPPSTPVPRAPAGGTNIDEQIRTASQRIARAPTADNIWMRGELYLEAKRYGEALADFDRAITLGPPSATFHFSRGNARMWLRNTEGALADYSEALRLNPSFAAALAGRANVYKEQGRLTQAMADYNAAVAINPRLFAALYGRGILHADAGRWGPAQADFTQAIANNRSHAYAYVRRAQAFEKLGERDKAIADYRDSLRGAPSLPESVEAFRIARSRLQELGVSERP